MAEQGADFVALPEHAQKAIADFLVGSGLADHLGDVRNSERVLWDLIDPEPWDWDTEGWHDDPWRNTKARLRRVGLLPADFDYEDES